MRVDEATTMLFAAAVIACAAFAALLQPALLQQKQGVTRLDSAIESLPKVELHAHLSGSIRPSTLVDLLRQKGEVVNEQLLGHERTLADCFAIFKLIHRAVDSLDAVRRVTRETLEDFAGENCVYLELRSTPRAFAGSTVVDYVAAVVGELASSPAAVTARLLVSIDRSLPPSAAAELVESIAALRRDPAIAKFVVGLDFSGHPAGRSFEEFASIFRRARDVHGLHCSIHCAETPRDDGDSDAILDFALESPSRVRLGHALRLTPAQLARASGLCIEVCPSSNAATLGLPSLRHHPLLRLDLKLAICTDDATVFDSGLTSELKKVAAALRLRGVDDVEAFVDVAAEHAFDQEACTRALALARTPRR